MLSSNAFNAFLKTLEEPPKHCIFILATTEKHKIIPTILSRCQIFDFKRITVTDAKNYLKVVAKAQNIDAEDDALHIIAQKADGAMRDALSIFDRVVSFSGRNLTRKAVSENLNVLDYETFFQITDLILDNAIPSLLVQFNQILARGFEGQHFIAGLASHFRDLYVAKSTETLELLEVGTDTQERYKLQSERTSPTFLKEAISLANDCDLKYKTSRNQRLLVELCLMKLASINFDGEKKKSEGFIIPASFFKDKNLSESKTELDRNIPQTNSVNSAEEQPSVEEPEMKYNPPKIEAPVIKGIKRQASGLSLKSIQQKKAHQIKQMDVEIKEEDLPSDSFTQDQLNEYWDTFVDKLEKKGKYNLAAILKIDTPKLTDDDVIQLEFPNSTNKIEVERNQFDLLQFLRKSLNNFNIRLEISVNEAMDKKYAYTAEDKYAKLLEKNPALETLKQTFNLDL
jgi:DNA polymerase-3 subunit gamma/tau